MMVPVLFLCFSSDVPFLYGDFNDLTSSGINFNLVGHTWTLIDIELIAGCAIGFNFIFRMYQFAGIKRKRSLSGSFLIYFLFAFEQRVSSGFNFAFNFINSAFGH